MADKTYKLTLTINGLEQSGTFTVPGGGKGDPGKDGTGISSIETTYCSDSLGTTIPSESTTWLSNIPSVDPGSYLWTKTTVRYTDTEKSDSVYYTVARQGKDGTSYSGSGIAVDTYGECLVIPCKETGDKQGYNYAYNEDSSNYESGIQFRVEDTSGSTENSDFSVALKESYGGITLSCEKETTSGNVHEIVGHICITEDAYQLVNKTKQIYCTVTYGETSYYMPITLIGLAAPNNTRIELKVENTIYIDANGDLKSTSQSISPYLLYGNNTYKPSDENASYNFYVAYNKGIDTAVTDSDYKLITTTPYDLNNLNSSTWSANDYLMVWVTSSDATDISNYIDYEKIGFSLDGSSGLASFTSYVFTRSSETPNPPNGGSYDSPIPTDTNSEGDLIWSDGVPTGEGQVWYSKRVFTSDGKSPQEENWSTPIKCLDSADIDFEYSAVENPSTPTTLAYDADKAEAGDYTDDDWHESNPNWHEYDYFTGTDGIPAASDIIWMAINKCVNNTWEGWQVFRVKGEQGDPGVVNGFTADIDGDTIGIPVDSSTYKTLAEATQTCTFHLYYNGIEENSSNYSISLDTTNSTATLSWFNSSGNTITVTIPASTKIEQQVTAIYTATCSKDEQSYSVNGTIKIMPIPAGENGKVTMYSLQTDPSVLQLLVNSTGNIEASSEDITLSVAKTSVDGETPTVSTLKKGSEFTSEGITIKYKTYINSTSGSEISISNGTSNTVTIPNSVVKTLCNRGDYIYIYLYVDNTLWDSERIPVVTDGIDGVPGTAATSYNFDVDSSTLTNGTNSEETPAYTTGTVTFDVIKTDHGTSTTSYEQLSSSAYNGSTVTTGLQVMAAGTTLTENTDYEFTVATTSPYKVTVALKESKVTATSITLQYYVSNVCVATAVIPAAIKGSDGKTTTESVTTLKYSVLRTVGDWSSNTSTYYGGDTASDNGIMYQDVVTWYDSSNSTKDSNDNSVYDTKYYVCIKTHSPSNTDISPNNPSNSTYWTAIGTTTSMIAVNDLIANYINALSISTDQLVILNDSNEVVAGMTGASSLTKGTYTDGDGNSSEKGTTVTYATSTDSSTTGSNGNIRIFAGTPDNSSNLYDCPFYVTDTGYVLANNLGTTLVESTELAEGKVIDSEKIATLIKALSYKMYDPEGNPVAGFLVSKSGNTYGAQMACKHTDGYWYIINFQKWQLLVDGTPYSWVAAAVVLYNSSITIDSGTNISTTAQNSTGLLNARVIYKFTANDTGDSNSNGLYFNSSSMNGNTPLGTKIEGVTLLTPSVKYSGGSSNCIDSNSSIFTINIANDYLMNALYFVNGTLKYTFTGTIGIPSGTSTYEIGFGDLTQIIDSENGENNYTINSEKGDWDYYMLTSDITWKQLFESPTSYGFEEE